ncbi:class I tRNA ligase family protein [Streptomyces sp. NPDC020807]|uniref:class I tRNA ligase family protein n=1 Tax=Streptomyces sp. NPDC020807 TaxID=3155119 RepID=UPI0033C1A3D2
MNSPSARLHGLSRSGERYFLAPVCLVPNGRAHLGHIAGPLLRMDVLKRHLRWSGADVAMVATSDSHESHVAIRGHKEGRTSVEVARDYHEQIRGDLGALLLEYDDFIDPLSPEWAERYAEVNHALLDAVIAAGSTRIVTDPMPRLTAVPEGATTPATGPRLGDIVTSGWHQGSCPDCGEGMTGYSCEGCGGLHAPHQVDGLRPAHFEGELTFDDVQVLHLDLADGPARLRAAAEAAGVRGDFLALLDRYLARNGTDVRLTVPSRWGIPRTDEGLTEEQVVWHGATLQIACHYLAAERYSELTGHPYPLAAGSDVTTVVGFGIDNALPYLVGGLGAILGQDTYKAIDHYLINQFYRLDGKKFSTSRRHVIWAGDLVETGGADPDLARLYLCFRNPEFTSENFDPREFVAFHNATAAEVGAGITEALGLLSGAQAPVDGPVVPSHWERAFLAAHLERLTSALGLEGHTVNGAYRVLREWLDRGELLLRTPSGAATYLAGLAHLALPLMPRFATALWQHLTGETSPTLAGLDAVLDAGLDPRRTTAGAPPVLGRLDAERFAGCVSLDGVTMTTGV